MADAIIGDPETGLAVEQRKRVTIGVELAAKPELLLFLDEPTSGLDSQSAFNIVRFLRKLAAAGQVRHERLISGCVLPYSILLSRGNAMLRNHLHFAQMYLYICLY